VSPYVLTLTLTLTPTPTLTLSLTLTLTLTRLSEYADVDATAQAAGQVLVNALLDVAAMPVAAMLTTANEVTLTLTLP